jgi:hypothetical protein
MKMTSSKILLIIKTTIFLTIFLTINDKSAQSADLLDEWKDKTKSVTGTLSKSIEDQSKKSQILFSGAFDKLGEYSSKAIENTGDFFQDFMDNFESKRETFEKAGFFLKSANVYFALPPKISLTFKNGKELEDKEYTNLANSLSDKIALKKMFEFLVLMKKINSGKYKPETTTIKLGLPPTVNLTFVLDKN